MRLIDADAIEYSESEDGFFEDYAFRYDINECPTVDAVPVVRCRECVHFEPFRKHDGFCKISTMLYDNDFFCKCGQRREDGDAE